MTQVVTELSRYIADFHALKEQQGNVGPAWVRKVREHALSQFTQLGFPTARRGNEKWKYTNVAPIARAIFSYPAVKSSDLPAEADLREVAPWHESWVRLVFVDGRYSKALSTAPAGSAGVRVESLAQAVLLDGEVAEKHIGRYASVEEDAFAALNTAFVQDGALVYVPEDSSHDVPIYLLFVSTGGPVPVVSYPRVLVVAGARSKATIIESYIGLSRERYFTDSVAEIVVGEGAQIDHYRLLLEGGGAFHVGVARVVLQEHSSFSSRAFSKGAALARFDLSVLLDGPGSFCNLNGLYVTGGTQHLDNFINIDHAKPSGTSRLYYKGILDGRSRAIFGGTVWVRSGAQKTDAQQTDKNLVLSPDAEVDSKPALFINADDVKCGHGATAGNIDQDTVFYMRSRGLDLDTASRLLIYGFASEIVDTVQIEPLKAYLEKLFLQSLPAYRFEF